MACSARPRSSTTSRSLYNVPGILTHGAAWYRQMGTEKAPGTKLYPISGHVKRTGCLEAPLGKFTLRQVIEGPAGGMRDGAPFKACHLGGAAGAMVGPQFLDVPLDFGSCMAAGAMLGAGDIVVLDAKTCIVDYLRASGGLFPRRVVRQVHALPGGHGATNPDPE